MTDNVTVLETRRLSMLPHHFRASLAIETAAYINFYMSNDAVGSGNINDLLKAKSRLDTLIHEATADKLAGCGSARE